MTSSMQPKWARMTARPQRHPNARMLAEITAGLTAPQKELPPKYFYDHRGSELFEEITRLPEYYPTRTERSLLQSWMPKLIPELGVRTLVELGAGSAEKSRIILSAIRASGRSGLYIPIDVSASFLNQTALCLRREYPGLTVEPAVADISEEFELPRGIPHPALYAFLGGTIGNFYPAPAVRLLSRVRSAMDFTDRFLMGVDLRKDVRRIEAAYNDSRGVTAAFNRNMLLVINDELGADFDPDAFEHHAFYEPATHRIEMHLVARMEHEVRVPGLGLVPFRQGESIRTEISCKHDRQSVRDMFSAAGLRVDIWKQDSAALFALVVGAPV
jgi:L-histidine N-alpha-methyltransferase